MPCHCLALEKRFHTEIYEITVPATSNCDSVCNIINELEDKQSVSWAGLSCTGWFVDSVHISIKNNDRLIYDNAREHKINGKIATHITIQF